MGYKVMVDDNFHYMDADERYTLGEFETLDEAIRACQSVVDDFLVHEYAPGMTADKLYSQYTSFGEDPFVFTGRGEVPFSAWTYAKERCAQLCGASEANDGVE
jgi:hypothetical protein